MKNPIAYALLLAATMTLAACDNTPEDKMESAQESAQDSAESAQDAANKTGEAIQQKAEETHEEATK